MAVLLNQASNLRLRLELARRLSDGVDRPATLEIAAAVERYKHVASGERGEHRYVPLVAFAGKPLFDMDLMTFLESAEALLSGQAEGAALEATTEPSIGVRLSGGPDAFLVEIGIDLVTLLEPIGGLGGEPGENLALFRFAANQRAVASFVAQLIDELGRFPTDPSRVSPGARES
jgi:hypothetical protein